MGLIERPTHWLLQANILIPAQKTAVLDFSQSLIWQSSHQCALAWQTCQIHVCRRVPA
jgi:hypothetical protein